MAHVYNDIQLTTFLDQIFSRPQLIEAQLTGRAVRAGRCGRKAWLGDSVGDAESSYRAAAGVY